MSPEAIAALVAGVLAVAGIVLAVVGTVRERYVALICGLVLLVVSVLVGLYLAHIDFGFYFPRSHIYS